MASLIAMIIRSRMNVLCNWMNILSTRKKEERRIRVRNECDLGKSSNPLD